MKPLDVSAIAEEEGAKVGLPSGLLSRLILSGENFGLKDIPTNAVSPKGAVGVGQIMPATWAGLQQQGVIAPDADITDPRTNIRAAAQVAKDGHAFGKGNPQVTAAWYNGGKVQAQAVLDGKQPPALETKNYLARTTPMADGTTPGGVKLGTKQTSKSYDTPTGALADEVSNAQSAQADLLKALTGQLSVVAANQADLGIQSERAGSAAAANDIALGNKSAIEQQDRIDTAALFGATNDKLQVLHDRRSDASNAMALLKTQIDEEAAVQPWDDPMRWLVNKVTLPHLMGTYNALNATKRNTDAEITNSMMQAQQKNALNAAPTVGAIQEAAATSAAVKVFEGLKQARLAQAQSASTLASSLMQEMAAGDKSMQTRLEVYRMFAVTQQLSAQQAADKEYEPILGGIKMKLDAMGADSQYVNMTWLKGLDPKKKSELMAMITSPGIGNDYGDSLHNIIANNASAGFAQRQPAAMALIQAQTGSKEFDDKLAELTRLGQQGDRPFARLSDAEKREVVLTKLSQDQYAAAQDPKVGGKGNNLLSDNNIYKLRIADTIQAPELQNNSVVKDLSQLIEREPRLVVTHDDIMKAYLARAKADPANLVAYTRDLQEFFLKGSEWQWRTSGAAILGMPKPQGYVLSGILTDATGRALNMRSTAEVENWAIRNLAQQSAATGIADMRRKEPGTGYSAIIDAARPKD